MKRIQQIRIQNFKAFQDEAFFDFGSKGKNVLVYGNNGSGKSSLFWALHTLLQSSGKEDNDIKKYFSKYVASNISTHQTLKNVFIDENIESYIKLTAIDIDTSITETYTISYDTINTNIDTSTIIQELNLASDFINYKLLHNFYQGSHKQEINLWPVFEKDIFPFLTEGTQNWLDDIIKDKTLRVPTSGGRVVSRGPRVSFEDKLNDLNDKIQNLLTDIQSNANEFIKEHFFDGKDVIRLTLTFNRRFNFDNVRLDLWSEGRESYRQDQLRIKLSVEVYVSEPTPHWKSIERAQSFLNEAQLTRIAIGVRIGALRTRPISAANFKVLVLDDMLISLDLSNRMDVVRIVLNKDKNQSLSFFDSYQKIIMTHDKGFFNLIRSNTDEEDWVYFDFQKDEAKNTAPTIKKNLTTLQRAVKFFEEDEFESCGNELRKQAEEILTGFLNPTMKKLDKEFESLGDKLDKAFKQLTNQRLSKFETTFLSVIELDKLKKLKTDYQSDTTLSQDDIQQLRSLNSRVLDFLIDINKEKDRKEVLIKQVKEILDRVLNAASHHGENPLYRAELKEAIEKMKNLKGKLQT